LNKWSPLRQSATTFCVRLLTQSRPVDSSSSLDILGTEKVSGADLWTQLSTSSVRRTKFRHDYNLLLKPHKITSKISVFVSSQKHIYLL